MAYKSKLQHLEIPSDWTVRRNVFYELDPRDEVPEDDKFYDIYCQEDMLYLTKGKFHLDLGWYGGDDLNNGYSGYCIHLLRGENWLNSELLEKRGSQTQKVIVNMIEEFIRAVDSGEFDELTGYKVDNEDDNNTNMFEDFDTYSVRQPEYNLLREWE